MLECAGNITGSRPSSSRPCPHDGCIPLSRRVFYRSRIQFHSPVEITHVGIATCFGVRNFGSQGNSAIA